MADEAKTVVNLHGTLADRLEQEGPFELYRDNSSTKSKKVWLTESECDLIVEALRIIEAMRTNPRDTP